MIGSTNRHRPFTVSTAIYWGLAGVAMAAAYYAIDKLSLFDPVPGQPTATPNTDQEAPTGKSSPPISSRQQHDKPGPQHDKRPAQPLTHHRPAPFSASAAEAQALVAELQALAGTGVIRSTDDAANINQIFDALARLGPTAVPALSDFLHSSVDIDFTAQHGRKLVNYPSLRAGVITVLGMIGGNAATVVLAETLAEARSPHDIAALTSALQWTAPGVYRQEILAAARESLIAAARTVADDDGRPTAGRGSPDVSPIYEVLRVLGNSQMLHELLDELDSIEPTWKSYSMVALSDMRDGQGASVLADMLVDERGALIQENLFALQMLAQASIDSSQAADSLLAIAAVYGDEIPANHWRTIAWTLQGSRFSLTTKISDPVSSADRGSDRAGTAVTVHSRNVQIIRTASDPATWPKSQIKRRVELVERLLATAPPGNAIMALESARERLLEVL